MSPFDPSAWSNASTDAQDGEAPPPGLYEVAVITAEVFTAKSSGDPYIRMAYKVMIGPLQGHEWSEVRSLSAKAMPVQKSHCEKLGLDISQVNDPDPDTALNQLDQLLSTVVGAYISVKVKQNGQYRNTDVQGRHAGPVGSDVTPAMATSGAAPGAAGLPAEDDADIPF